jgi:hypothetical protein
MFILTQIISHVDKDQGLCAPSRVRTFLMSIHVKLMHANYGTYVGMAEFFFNRDRKLLTTGLLNKSIFNLQE